MKIISAFHPGFVNGNEILYSGNIDFKKHTEKLNDMHIRGFRALISSSLNEDSEKYNRPATAYIP